MVPRSSSVASHEEHGDVQRVMKRRSSFAHFTIKQMDGDGRTRLRCPAREMLVAHPIYPP